MSASSFEIAIRPAAQEPSGPGDDTPSEPLALAETVRPRFFFGQLLTEADLEALVAWARQRIGRSRHRDGWGVVCGLDVRLGDSCQVVVGPGLARNGAGDDIVVAVPTLFDLSEACPAAAPDGDPPEETTPQEITVAGEKLSTERLRIVDLLIRYREEESDLQAALRQDACLEQAACEPSRVRELFELGWREADLGETPPQYRARLFREAFDEAARVIQELQWSFPLTTEPDWDKSFANDEKRRQFGGELREWLRKWLEAHPACRFGWLGDHVRSIDALELATDPGLVKILFYLVLDARSCVLSCACSACDSDVALARVWLYSHETCCRVILIDDQPPYRRPLGTDCWPAPLGQVNLGQVLWRRREEACLRLADLGFEVHAFETQEPPTDFEELQEALGGKLFASAKARLDVRLFEDEALGSRVIALVEATTKPVQKLGLEVAKRSGKVQRALPGQTVKYTYSLTNTGELPLTVELADSRYGEIATGVELMPGQEWSDSYSFDVPIDARQGLFETRVDAVGRNAEHGEVSAFAVHRLEIGYDDFCLIGMMQKWLHGQLTDGEPLYKAGIFTFAELAAAPTEKVMEVYSRVLSHLADKGRALAELWKKLAGWLAPTGIHVAADVIAYTQEELGQLLPGLDAHRLEVFLKRARRAVEKKEDRTLDEDFADLTPNQRKKVRSAGARSFPDWLLASDGTLQNAFPGTRPKTLEQLREAAWERLDD